MERRGQDLISELEYRSRGGLLDSDGKVVEQVICRACGYNLYQLNAGDRCPECGTPILVSLEEDLLRYSHPAWLRQVLYGSRLAAGGLFALLPSLLAVLYPAVLWPVAFAVPALLIPSLWLTSAPEPSRDRLTWGQIAMRVGAGASAGFAALCAAGYLGHWSHVFPLAAIASLALILTSVSVQIHYLGGVLMRIPEPHVAEKAQTLAWSLIWPVVFFAVTMSLGLQGIAIGGILWLWINLGRIACMHLELKGHLLASIDQAEEHWAHHQRLSATINAKTNQPHE